MIYSKESGEYILKFTLYLFCLVSNLFQYLSFLPGALNEAMSDIFGAMVDAQEGAKGLDIWKLGEDIYTPGTPDDALRFMHDPVLGGDYDWYPTRYTGTADNGGVHWNSGIANLGKKCIAFMNT